MHRPRNSARRLIGVTVLACAAVLAPVTMLVVAGAVTPAGATVPQCSTAGLVVWLDTESNGTAGSIYFDLEFTNLSGHTCTMHAYPGVSAVNLAGHQLGSPATRTAGAKPVITLAAGGTATAVLQIVDTGVFSASQCDQVHAAGLRVYPPDQTAAKVVPYPFLACARAGTMYLSVQPMKKAQFGWA
ncbi:MAG: DUF4232 domain-containing protein [Acidimicrobiales bacterium]|jgi:hypothetical protein